MRGALLMAALPGLLAGCATVKPERGHDEVARLVQERAAVQTGWAEGPPDRARVRAQVRELLRDGLTSEEAVRLALVNGPALQATFEELGVAQAELLEAGLLPNPSLGAQVRFPDTPSVTPHLEFSLVQEVLDLIMLPARKRVAESQFRAAMLRAADEALTTITETRAAYTELQAAERMLSERRIALAAADASAALTRLRYEAGNVSALELYLDEVAWHELRAEAARDELHLLRIREALNRRLGLWGAAADWRVAEPLPELPAEDALAQDLEQLALRRRLDVDAARQDLQLMDQALGLARSSAFLGRVEVGVSTEREEGVRLTGPSLTLELPIFDQRQAMIARLEAQQRQTERRLEAAAINARSEVREARARLLTARRLVEHYAKTLLPALRRVVEASQLQYNAMSLSPNRLLEARRELADGTREYVEALAEYWNARAELERTIGGRLEVTR